MHRLRNYKVFFGFYRREKELVEVSRRISALTLLLSFSEVNFHRIIKELTEMAQSVSALPLLLPFSAVKKSSVLITLVFIYQLSSAQPNTRQDISLNNNWQTIATNDNKILPANSYQVSIDKNWKTVNIPHNWDAYDGYRRLLHG